MRAFVLGLAGLMAACSPSVSTEGETTDSSTADSGTTESGSIDSGPPLDFCKESKARTEKCDAGVFDAAQCAAQLACYQTLVRPEDRSGLLTCFATRPCGVSDDKCAADAASKYLSDSTVSAWVKSCTDRRAACMNVFADDYCSYTFGLFTDEFRTKMQTCLAKGCSEIRACFDTIVTAAGCK